LLQLIGLFHSLERIVLKNLLLRRDIRGRYGTV
jgi:hypothetical protein